MPEEIKMKMARAYPDQLQRTREWFQKIEEMLDDEGSGPFEVGAFIMKTFEKNRIDEYERILFGYETLIDNACDQTKSYLEFKPEILVAIAVASRAEELVDAAEKVFMFKDVITTAGPHVLPLALAMIDLHKATEKVKQGMASKPSAGQNPEHSA